MISSRLKCAILLLSRGSGRVGLSGDDIFFFHGVKIRRDLN